MRIEATNEGDESKATTAKLFGNSGYGKTAEDVTKHTHTKIVSEKEPEKLDKLERSAFCQSTCQILTEDDEIAAYEVKMRRRKIQDDKDRFTSRSVYILSLKV